MRPLLIFSIQFCIFALETRKNFLAAAQRLDGIKVSPWHRMRTRGEISRQVPRQFPLLVKRRYCENIIREQCSRNRNSVRRNCCLDVWNAIDMRKRNRKNGLWLQSSYQNSQGNSSHPSNTLTGTRRDHNLRSPTHMSSINARRTRQPV